jgi:L-fucose mutarotase
VLKNIDPLLTADLLGHLRAMGHGDVLAVVDRNFPAASTARRLVVLPGSTAVDAATAIASVLPVDTYTDPPVHWMGPVGDEQTVLPVHRDVLAVLAAAEGRPVPGQPLERFEFYRRAAEAYLVVATGEDRPYADFLITKGVL